MRSLAVTLLAIVLSSADAHGQALKPLRGPVPSQMGDVLMDANDHAPDWSPDGTRILVTRRNMGRSYQLFLMRPDGSNLHPITSGPGSNIQGTFSPSGDRIAFRSTRDGVEAIYVMNSDGTSPRRLTTDSVGMGERPTWSPDGRRIAHHSTRNGHWDIWTMNADGSDAVALTDDSIPDYSPVFSPDGSLIAFDRSTAGNRDIWVMGADGSNLRRITTDPGYEGYPAWSPDGSRIAFIGLRNGSSAIYSMRADGTDQRRLTNAPGWNFDPVWSPDGSQIVFDSRRDGRRGTYVMNADGTDQRKITNREASHFVAVAREEGAAEAVRRYRVARIDRPDATFFLPVEVQMLADELRVDGRPHEAALLLEAVLDHHPTVRGVDGSLRAVYADLGRPTPPTRAELVSAFSGSVSEGLALLAETSFEFPGLRILSSGDVAGIANDLAESGDSAASLRLLRIGLAMYPEHDGLYEVMGERLVESGQREEGLEALRRAVALNPDNVTAQQLIDATEGGSGS